MELSMKELAKKNGCAYQEYANGKHLRLIGSLTVDYWPSTKTAWIMGTRKSFKVQKPEEVFEVCNAKKIPKDVSWNEKKLAKIVGTEFINIEYLCAVCCKRAYKQKSYTDKLISGDFEK